MIGRRPVEPCPLDQEHLFFDEEIEEEFLIIGNIVFFYIDFRKKVERAPGLTQVMPGIERKASYAAFLCS